MCMQVKELLYKNENEEKYFFFLQFFLNWCIVGPLKYFCTSLRYKSQYLLLLSVI